MRIIEGKGPPSVDTFGTSNHLYKDTETGKFYRCHGNINEDRTLPYGPAHKHPGEQYLWTPTEGGGSADWNASEGEAGHVKNRTHYVDRKILEKRAYDIRRINTQYYDKYWGSTLGSICKNNNVVMPDNVYIRVCIAGKEYIFASMPPNVGTSSRPEYKETIQIGGGTILSVSLSKYSHGSNGVDRVNYYYNAQVVTSNNELIGQEYTIEMIEEVLVPLDEMFIPSSIPKVQTATVGQTVVVKAVDENGKPTEWETADVGGGSTLFYVGYEDDNYLYHDKETTMKVSKDEYRLAMFSGVVIIKTIDEMSVYYPSFTDFGSTGATVSLWNDGDWRIVHTGEYVDLPPV